VDELNGIANRLLNIFTSKGQVCQPMKVVFECLEDKYRGQF